MNLTSILFTLNPQGAVLKIIQQDLTPGKRVRKCSRDIMKYEQERGNTPILYTNVPEDAFAAIPLITQG